MSDKLAIIGHDSESPPEPHAKRRKTGPEPLLARPEAAPEARVELGEASENTARRLRARPRP